MHYSYQFCTQCRGVHHRDCFVGVSSVARTPVGGVPRRSKSYRQSYRSYAGTVSHLGYTPGFTKRRQTTSRLTPRHRSLTVRNKHTRFVFVYVSILLNCVLINLFYAHCSVPTVVGATEHLQRRTLCQHKSVCASLRPSLSHSLPHSVTPSALCLEPPPPAGGEPGAAGPAGEGVAAVLRHAAVPLPPQPAEGLLAAAGHVRGVGAAAGRGGGGGAGEQPQGVLHTGGRDGPDGG